MTAVTQDGDRDRLSQLIERCKADTNGLSILGDAHRNCNHRWHALARDLHDAIKGWQPPKPVAMKTAASAALRIGEHAPADLRRALTEFAREPRGHYRQLIERCRGYDDGCSVLSEAYQFGNSRWKYWVGSELEKALDAAIKGWQPPRGAPLWSEGQPNPSSKDVSRIRKGNSTIFEFLCPTCSTPNTVLDSELDDLTGVSVICHACENVSHFPAAYKTGACSDSELAVYGAVRVPIAEFVDWELAHPVFLTSDRHVHPDTEYHGNYGLWGFCAGCHYKYASTVLRVLPSMLESGAKVLFGVHSAKSGQDADALSKKQCPRCGRPDLLAIMTPVPKYVRDAIEAEKKKRGL